MSSRGEWTHQPTGRGGDAGLRSRIKEQSELLGKAPLFEGLSKRHLREIAKVSGARRCAAGLELVKEGSKGSVFFVILDGTAKVVRGGRTVKRLGPGDFFGEMSLLTDAPRSASVIAEEPLRCLTLSSTGLRSVLLANPSLSVRMLGTMADRLAEVDRRLTS